MPKELFIITPIGITAVTITAILIHLVLKLIRINRWIISFPLASLICYCIFCTWFVGCPFPLHLEGHDFGIICFLGSPILLVTIFLLKHDWLALQLIDPMLPLLIAFQYLMIGWLIDRIKKVITKKRKLH
jgi:hypothetical protein